MKILWNSMGNGAVKDVSQPLLYYPAINQINLRFWVDNTISSSSAWRKRKKQTNTAKIKHVMHDMTINTATFENWWT